MRRTRLGHPPILWEMWTWFSQTRDTSWDDDASSLEPSDGGWNNREVVCRAIRGMWSGWCGATNNVAYADDSGGWVGVLGVGRERVGERERDR